MEQELLKIYQKLQQCENISIQVLDDSITVEYDKKNKHYVKEYLVDDDSIILWNEQRY